MFIQKQAARRELWDGWKELLSVRPEACSSWGTVGWNTTEEEQMIIDPKAGSQTRAVGRVEGAAVLGVARGLQQLGQRGLEHDAPPGGATVRH